MDSGSRGGGIRTNLVKSQVRARDSDKPKWDHVDSSKGSSEDGPRSEGKFLIFAKRSTTAASSSSTLPGWLGLCARSSNVFHDQVYFAPTLGYRTPAKPPSPRAPTSYPSHSTGTSRIRPTPDTRHLYSIHGSLHLTNRVGSSLLHAWVHPTCLERSEESKR